MGPSRDFQSRWLGVRGYPPTIPQPRRSVLLADACVYLHWLACSPLARQRQPQPTPIRSPARRRWSSIGRSTS